MWPCARTAARCIACAVWWAASLQPDQAMGETPLSAETGEFESPRGDGEGCTPRAAPDHCCACVPCVFTCVRLVHGVGWSWMPGAQSSRSGSSCILSTQATDGQCGMCAECVLCGRSRRSRLPFVVVVLVPTLRSGRRRVVYDVTRGRLSGPFWGCVLAF